MGVLAFSTTLSFGPFVDLAAAVFVAMGPESLEGAGRGSGMLSSDDSVGILLGTLRFVGPSSLSRSNMDMSDPVGGIEPESTASLPVAALPTLSVLLGDLLRGHGLGFRLAASVAAMKLGLFGSTLVCKGPPKPVPPSLVA